MVPDAIRLSFLLKQIEAMMTTKSHSKCSVLAWMPQTFDNNRERWSCSMICATNLEERKSRFMCCTKELRCMEKIATKMKILRTILENIIHDAKFRNEVCSKEAIEKNARRTTFFMIWIYTHLANLCKCNKINVP